MSIKLRKADWADCDDILQWRNDAETRRNSFSNHVILAEEHQSWYGEILNDRSGLVLIGEDEVRQEKVGVAIFKMKDGIAEININIKPEKRKEGWGTALISEAVRYFKMTNVGTPIVAKIKRDNAGSIKLFTKAGFAQEEITDNFLLFNYHDR